MTNVQAGGLYGTLNLLILRILSGDEPLHGLAVQRRIREVSEDVLRVEVGALYPALHRLEKGGLVASEWGISDRRRRAKFYRITQAGRARLESEASLWRAHARAVGQVLTEAPGPVG